MLFLLLAACGRDAPATPPPTNDPLPNKPVAMDLVEQSWRSSPWRDEGGSFSVWASAAPDRQPCPFELDGEIRFCTRLERPAFRGEPADHVLIRTAPFWYSYVGGIACTGQPGEVCLHHYGPSSEDDGRTIRTFLFPSEVPVFAPDAQERLLLDWLPTRWGYPMVRVSELMEGRWRVRCFFPEDNNEATPGQLEEFCRTA